MHSRIRALAGLGLPPLAGFRHRATFAGGRLTDKVILRHLGSLDRISLHRVTKAKNRQGKQVTPVAHWGNRIWITLEDNERGDFEVLPFLPQPAAQVEEPVTDNMDDEPQGQADTDATPNFDAMHKLATYDMYFLVRRIVNVSLQPNPQTAFHFTSHPRSNYITTSSA